MCLVWTQKSWTLSQNARRRPFSEIVTINTNDLDFTWYLSERMDAVRAIRNRIIITLQFSDFIYYRYFYRDGSRLLGPRSFGGGSHRYQSRLENIAGSLE